MMPQSHAFAWRAHRGTTLPTKTECYLLTSHCIRPFIAHASLPSLTCHKRSTLATSHAAMQQYGSAGHAQGTPLCILPGLELPADTFELDDSFAGLADDSGRMTVAGFGSLLSERSARTTFPTLENFRPAKIKGWRRVFAHTADIFYKRGIARVETGEVSSLSLEPCPGEEVVVSLFEVPHSPEAVTAFIEREHEFRFVAVRPWSRDGQHRMDRLAVICARFSDEEYKARRCPPEEFERRWGQHGVTRIWRDDILPCRVYLRHCVLAAKGFTPEAYDSFLDHTFLADRVTSVRHYLEQHPGIMEELPPRELVGRYSG